MQSNKILISRTDSIGDVILTLPICDWIKEHFPNSEIYFLARNYTKAIVESYSQIDHFMAWDEIEKLSKKEQLQAFHTLNLDYVIHVFPRKEIAWMARFAGIKHRIGTSHRFYHFFTCNESVNFTRRNSELHESQLNFNLLKPLGLHKIPSLMELNKSTKFFKVTTNLEAELEQLLDTKKRKVILHPKSQGSAIEWGIENFISLSKILVENDCKVFFSGTESEGALFREQLPQNENRVDITGKMNLETFIAFINKADALVAASTGPLHIAGILNKRTIGLFSPRQPIHPGRWQAIGDFSSSVVFDEYCETCAEGKSCDCITKITPQKVAKLILM